MTERITTYCDKCNPQQLSAYAMRGFGITEHPFDTAKESGWIERDGQHICPSCLDAEDDTDAT